MNLVDFVRPSVLPRTIVKGERSRKNRNWVRTKYRKFSSFLKWHRYNNTYVLFSFFFFFYFSRHMRERVCMHVYLCMCRCARVSRLHVLQDVSKFFTLTNNNNSFHGFKESIYNTIFDRCTSNRTVSQHVIHNTIFSLYNNITWITRCFKILTSIFQQCSQTQSKYNHLDNFWNNLYKLH